MGGHSAAAGHGNNFQQQYTMQFANIMGEKCICIAYYVWVLSLSYSYYTISEIAHLYPFLPTRTSVDCTHLIFLLLHYTTHIYIYMAFRTGVPQVGNEIDRSQPGHGWIGNGPFQSRIQYFIRRNGFLNVGQLHDGKDSRRH